MQQVRSMCACFGFRLDACERWSFFAMSVTPVSLRPLITVGNLGAWSCLDIVEVYVLSVRINHLVKPFLLQVCMLLFSTRAEYFLYSHLPYFLHIVAMPCCSGDEEYFDEDFF
jgi:hypothetical protein